MKILKSCNCCGKVKLIKATHNYGRCCGGSPAFTPLTEEALAARQAHRARMEALIDQLAAMGDDA